MIATFYSFKGGVGRSMALANVGRWLERNGLRVIVVDWDLEAPGLESYFLSDETVLKQSRSLPGLIDLMNAYLVRWQDLPWPTGSPRNATLSAEDIEQNEGGTFTRPPEGDTEKEAAVAMLCERLPPIGPLLQPMLGSPAIGDRPDRGGLWLLSAGARDGTAFGRYADAVQNFDWLRFYARHRGETFFEWLRVQLRASADITLVDSRTGVTEMGGVCTRQMADVVVALCATNEANLSGIERVIDSLQAPTLLAARRQRPIEVVPVPSRVDRQAENTRRNEWRDGFLRRMSDRLGEDAQQFWELQIPYTPYYSFEEKLVIAEPDRHEDLERAYSSLGLAVAERLTMRLDDSQKLGLLTRHGRSDDTVANLVSGPDLYGEWVWQQFDEAEREIALRLLLRLVRVGRPEEGDAAAALDATLLPEDERPLLERLIARGFVRQPAEGKALVRLVRDDLLQWHRLAQRVEQDRDFLLWRQQLDSLATRWIEANGDDGALISGTALAEARVHTQHHPSDLLPIHTEFISASVSHVERQEEERATLERKLRAAEAAVQQIDLQPRRDNSTRTIRPAIGIGVACILSVGVATAWLLVPDSPSNDPSVAARVELALSDADLAYQRGDLAASRMAAERAVALSPADSRGYLARGLACAADPRSQLPAAKDLRKAIELGAGPVAYDRFVRLYAQMGGEENERTANTIILEGLQRYPDEWSLYLTLGMLKEKQGADGEAEQAYTEAIRRDRGNAKPYFERGRLLLEMKRLDDARADLTMALKVSNDPDLSTAAQTLLERSGEKGPHISGSPVTVSVANPPQGRADLVKAVEHALRSSGFAAQPSETHARPGGSIRYFSADDERVAQVVKGLVETALAREGDPVRLLIQLAPPYEGRAGLIEVNLPGKGSFGTSRW